MEEKNDWSSVVIISTVHSVLTVEHPKNEKLTDKRYFDYYFSSVMIIFAVRV